MPRVDFYIVEKPDEQGCLRFACRLVEKAWQLGHRVFVHTESSEFARDFDTLLWTFRQDSFVPHALAGSPAEGDEPIVIGDGRAPQGEVDVLINLARTVPLWAERSRRVAEVVGGDPSARHAGRDRYRSYRDLGFEIDSHKV